MIGSPDEPKPPDLSGEDKLSSLSELSKTISAKSDELAKLEAKEIFKPVSETQAEVEEALSLLESAQEFMFMPKKKNRKGFLAILPFDTPLLSYLKVWLLTLAQSQRVGVKPSSHAVETSQYIHKLFRKFSGHDELIEAEGREVFEKIDKSGISEVYAGGWQESVNAVEESLTTSKTKMIKESHVSTIGVIANNADHDQVAGETISNAYSFNGQFCSSQKGLLIESSIFDELVAKLQKRIKLFMAPFPPEQPESTVTQQVDRSDESKVYEALSDSIAEGAEILAGGSAPEKLFYPTLVTGVRAESEFVSEDFRAPYIWVEPYKDHPDEFLDKIQGEKRAVIYGRHATLASRLKSTLGWEVFDRDSAEEVLPWKNSGEWLRSSLKSPDND